jgi:hypothetical protein
MATAAADDFSRPALNEMAEQPTSAHNRAMDSQFRPTPSPRAQCARCGAAFACSPGGDCWCAAEPVRLPMPSPLSDEGCLCAVCLRAATAAAGRAARSN